MHPLDKLHEVTAANVANGGAIYEVPGIYIATRNVLTGHMSEIECFDNIADARRAAQERADDMYTGSVWITTGHPSNRYAALLETVPAAKV